jgi:hypothetical protein
MEMVIGEPAIPAISGSTAALAVLDATRKQPRDDSVPKQLVQCALSPVTKDVPGKYRCLTSDGLPTKARN